MKDLISGEILGNQFQKRGLPHAHIPIILANYERTMTPEDVDKALPAEFPPDPNDTVDEEEAKQCRQLQDIVVTNMVHGPCGADNPNCPCMDNGRCSKTYPKPFQKKTIVDPDNKNPTYMRCSP